jgi:1,2-diacylglycerol 3-alpha-glucosyltransferase
MRMRLALITEIIAPYRIPVFNALAENPDVELYAIFLSETDAGLRDWQVYKEEIRFTYRVLPSWRSRLGKYNVLLNRQMGASLRAVMPHAVLCGGYNYLAAWSAAFWARRNGVPLLLWSESTERDARGNHRSVELLKSRFFRRCSSFVVPGRSAECYVRQFGVEHGSIFVAPNAVDLSFFSRAADKVHQESIKRRQALDLPARYFLYSGRLVTEKGIFDLLRAYAKLDVSLRQEVAIVFAGDGPQKNRLMKMAEDIVPGDIRFRGFLQRESLAECYALADALVLPTHSDTWGLVVNEAMACGLPVIVTDVAGCAADLVKGGVNGYTVPRGDSDQLAIAMKALAQNPELCREMGRRSRQRIQTFSPEACANGIANAFFSVLRTAS